MSLVVSCRFSRPGFVLDADLTVGSNEMVLLSGPNGSGKTTLLHLVAGLLAVERGEISLAGRTVDRADAGPNGVFVQPEDRNVGLLPQGGALFGHLSALENVAFGLRARGMGRVAARARAAEMLERTGVGNLAGRRPHEMSGGQRQRVAIARTMATTPTILLLDEPTAALDEEGRAGVLSLLGDLATGFGGPIVIVSHEALDELTPRCRRMSMDSQPVAGTGERHSVLRSAPR